MMLKFIILLCSALLYVNSIVIGMPEFVIIGDPGNIADVNGYGAVDYSYKISRNEITITQFQEAVGAGSGDEDYWNDGVRTAGVNAPSVNMTLNEAKKYCNYLTSGTVNNGFINLIMVLIMIVQVL